MVTEIRSGVYVDELHVCWSRRNVGSATQGGHRRHQGMSLCGHPCHCHHWRQQGQSLQSRYTLVQASFTTGCESN